MIRLAEERTLSTIRHEGAHQLFFTYGVHSSFHIENEWLVEGFAVFCETEHIGNVATMRVKLVRSELAKKKHIPLRKLLEYRPPTGFSSLENASRIDLAYSESWSLIHYLMADAFRRNGLFEFVRYIRDPRHLDESVRIPRIEMLCRFLQTTPAQLSADWKQYVNQL